MPAWHRHAMRNAKQSIQTAQMIFLVIVLPPIAPDLSSSAASVFSLNCAEQLRQLFYSILFRLLCHQVFPLLIQWQKFEIPDI